VRQTFAQDARNKQLIAVAIGRRFPELAPHVPPYRKCWMSEDYRMSIFDAVALALTYFHQFENRMTNALAKSRMRELPRSEARRRV